MQDDETGNLVVAMSRQDLASCAYNRGYLLGLDWETQDN